LFIGRFSFGLEMITRENNANKTIKRDGAKLTSW